MKNLPFSIICLLCCVFTLSAFAAQPAAQIPSVAQAPALAKILNRGTLRVAMYHKDTPPFYYHDAQGTLTGVDVELIRGFADKLGVNLIFDRSAKTLNQAIDMVAEDKADLAICKLSITFDRASRVLFTRPYIRLRKGLLVNRILLQQQLNNRSKIETIQTLQGKLAVIGNSSYVGYARQRFSQMTLVPYPNWQEAIEALKAQEVIAAFRDEAEIKKVIVDNKNNAMSLLTVVLEKDYDPKGIALPPNGHFLRALLESYLDNLSLELNADKVLFNYDDVINQIHRY
ncbi:substrate-binding periplasmic protein [Pseudoalteromonas viridis]|uniref:Transporter substrate-binding domain-containing protein n=1 Tax=Pseudoalteromonas viridis TaxID=339617 RepID=A0ABX7V8F1_9GAMM|nr:transporter substrate-binding domain-containing protein [Pseudoalteromonas viridis]QTL34953.1 transporter substrate-binding domain-containing protein [Pseudoalteromonas viridis]